MPGKPFPHVMPMWQRNTDGQALTTIHCW